METIESKVSQAATLKLSSNPKYTNYLAWLKQNQVRIDRRIGYPTVFQKDRVGVLANEKIQAKRAIVAVPYSLIITSKHIRTLEIYQSIISENTVLFNGEEGDIYLLCMHLIVEKLKGQKGFYHPYFGVVSPGGVLKWNKKEIAEVQHPMLIAEITEHKEEIEEAYVTFLRIIRTNEDVFPSEIKNQEYRELFEWAYEFVRTRAFNTPASYLSLIPLGDAFNHDQPSNSLSHSFIDLEKWKNKEESQGLRNKINLAIFNNPELNPTADEFKLFKQKEISDRARYINKHQNLLEGMKDKLSEEKAIQRINFLQYNTSNHSIRQLRMFEEDYEVDDDNHEVDYQQFRKYLVKEKSIVKGKKPVSQELGKEYWEMYGEKVGKKKNKYLEEDQEDEGEGWDQLSAKSKNSESNQEGSQSTEDEFEWVSESPLQNIYFVLYTDQAAQKGDQICISYGNRSNNFLLLHYSFSMLQNQFDYYMLRLRIDGKKKKPQELVIYQFDKKQKGIIVTKQIRIMKDRICIELVNHCRYILSPLPVKSIMIPNDKQTQLKVLELAKSIVKYLQNQYETSAEEDEQFLENKALSQRMFFALCIRLGHKQILDKQVKLLNKAIEFVGRFKKNKIEIKEAEIGYVAQLKPYLENLERSNL